MDKIDLTK